jgi:hypothetical protein
LCHSKLCFFSLLTPFHLNFKPVVFQQATHHKMIITIKFIRYKLLIIMIEKTIGNTPEK